MAYRAELLALELAECMQANGLVGRGGSRRDVPPRRSEPCYKLELAYEAAQLQAQVLRGVPIQRDVPEFSDIADPVSDAYLARVDGRLSDR